MLTRLSIKNFRLLRDVTIDVKPGKPIVLIGPSSSGKSSVLQVLDLLGRWPGEGFEKGLLAYGGSGAVTTFSRRDESITIEATIEDEAIAGLEIQPTRLHYGLVLGMNGEIQKEWLRSVGSGGEADEVMSRSEDKIQLWNDETGSGDAQAGLSKRQLSLELIKQTNAYPSLDEIRAALSMIHVYDGFLTTPLWARHIRERQISPHESAVLAPAPRIDRRGLTLVNALYDLQNNHADEWDLLFQALRAEFPFVQRLEFPADPAGGRIALGWRDRRHPGVRMFGHQMSEGMTSYLCLLAAILSPAPAAALAFDEPGTHLHPSAVRRVIGLLERASRRMAIFVATRSERVIDYLSDPVASVRICEPSDEGVTVRTADKASLDAFRAAYARAGRESL